MALADLTDPSAVLQALAEADRLGEQGFLAKYGYGAAAKYVVEHEGRLYPSKAIVGAAHAFQHPERGPLTNSDFNGGRPTIQRLELLGFTVKRMSDEADVELGPALSSFMDHFAGVRGTRLSREHEAGTALRRCASIVEALLPGELEGAEVRPSVGKGNWASVPWIAVLHPRETTTTRRGIYPVILFNEDMKEVHLTLAQGVTELRQVLGWPRARELLQRRAVLLRDRLTSVSRQGFQLDNHYNLGPSDLGRSYVTSTIARKAYDRDELENSAIGSEMVGLLEQYGELMWSDVLSEIQSASVDERSALVVYVGQNASHNFDAGGRAGWWGWKDAPTGLEGVSPGDLIAFGRGFSGGSPRVEQTRWEQERLDEVVVGRITSLPERTDRLVMPDEQSGQASYPWKMRFEQIGSEADVSLAPGARLSAQASDALRRSGVSRGVALKVPVSGSPLLEEHMNASPGPVSGEDVAAAAGAFVDAVETSGVRLRSEDVTAFLAALLTKPFSILTGQSGSGKTQLALRLGEWFGSLRHHVVPVRPDWTGPEYLFGYADALRSTPGRTVWAVPDALEFILRAAHEPDEPYLLVLDEMNLAHVERYFADYLSGLESRATILPELTRDQGDWIVAGNSQRLPLPRNLFVVGTVNVDETTYLFSPKVLDRAFTFEFRTASAELDARLRRPSSVDEASGDHRRTLTRLVADDEWHLSHPHVAVGTLVDELRRVHDLLAPTGHDFGHRVFFESLRLAAVLQAAGITDEAEVLDRIVLTKVLPKLHGTRARIERPLEGLLHFANGSDDPDAAPWLPRTAAKLSRMLAVVREAQFVSFTE